jgi:ferredoxin-type protein NapH
MRKDLPIYNESVALLDNPVHEQTGWQKAALGLVGVGVVIFFVALTSDLADRWPAPTLAAAVLGFVGGGLAYGILSRGPHRRDDNHGTTFSQNTARGAFAWVFAVVLTLLYILLYWYPSTLSGAIALVDPLSQWLRGQPATLDNGGQWFLYGTFYTGAILVMGVRALRRYWKSRYHTAKTISVMFFQLGFAWMLPYLLVRFNQPELYLHYFWPLDYYLLFPSSVESLWESGALGAFMIFWSIALLLIATPILTYFFGKRWYCSWVCGCGGLAETAGDSYRHLSSKSLTSWKIERWMIHSVLVVIVLATALLWYTASTGNLGWVV